ncbi:MAG: LysR family transcriptional regulator [Gammaproteobacteria bacterium]|nr:LysR family transcriptional regulator [Gammaproteobacteria bacterium]
MARKLPPLHLLQLFEAAGRNLSFKKASEELFLTPSAISHQIKALEENLGIELFKRLTRGVQLTPAGKQYLGVVQKVFQTLDKGTTTLKQQFSSESLRITTFTAMTNNIIIPNLSLFQTENPEFVLDIDTKTQLMDLRYDDFDLALRLGDGNWPDFITEKLFDLQITPLCSPAFAKKHQLKDISQITSIPLIHISNMPTNWHEWATEFKISNIESSSNLSLGSYDAAIQAAHQGLGLALGGIPLENFALESGQLVRPFEEHIHFSRACYAVYRKQDKDRKDINAFLGWFKNLIEKKVDEHNHCDADPDSL